jgi:hypothetical protein
LEARLLLHLDMVCLDDLSNGNMAWLDLILDRHLLHASAMPLLFP